MKEPLAPKDRPILTAHEAHPSPGETRRGEGPRYVVGVRFYRRMKLKRAYPMAVSLSPTAGHLHGIKSHVPTVEIRPVLAGALVTPSHYELETTGTTPAFYVTPLARGQLDSRLEVYSHGRLLQEIPLPVKGTSQRLTWILLLLTIVIPLGMWYFLRQQNLSTIAAPAQTPAAETQQAQAEEEDQGQAKNDEQMDRMAMKRMGQTPLPGTTRKGGEAMTQPIAKSEVEPEEPKQNYHPLPKTTGPVERATMQVLPDFPKVTESIAAGIQAGYDGARGFAADLYLVFYVFLALLALTLLSWVVHAGRRASRRGQPIALGA